MAGDDKPDKFSADDLIEMAPIEETNELIEHFKKQVDRQALRENLKLTPAERLQKLERMMREKYRRTMPADFPSTAAGRVLLLEEPAKAYAGCDLAEEAPAEETNDLIEAFKKDVDRTLLIENLKLTPAQRMEKFEANMEMIYEVRRAGQRMREKSKHDK